MGRQNRAHEWANQIVNKRHGVVRWAGNPSVEGRCLFSYSTIIGELVQDRYGETVALLNTVTYSSTTSSHQYEMRFAVRHLRSLNYRGFRNAWSAYGSGHYSSPEAQFSHHLEQFLGSLAKYVSSSFYDEKEYASAKSSMIECLKWWYHFNIETSRLQISYNRYEETNAFMWLKRMLDSQTAPPYDQGAAVILEQFDQDICTILNVSPSEFHDARNKALALRIRRQEAAARGLETRRRNEEIRTQQYHEARKKELANREKLRKPEYWLEFDYPSEEAYLNAYRLCEVEGLPDHIQQQDTQLIRVDKTRTHVFTSRGASVTLDKRLFNLIHSIIESGETERLRGMEISGYRIIGYSNDALHIGCHKFTKSEIQNFITLINQNAVQQS